jgi:diguanylate cyclase (GGDEF)-like protein
MRVGENMNKFELYEKLFGISDVMSLYIKDPLTGTLTRRGFEKKISEKLTKDGKMKKELAVVSIDVDGLKLINDTYGHNDGDEAIKEMANCIENALNSEEFVARMGGDEFEAVLVINEPGRVGKFIRGVRNNIREVNLSGKYEFELGASIGTCEVTDWHGVGESMKKADKAMYLEKKAKKKGR